MVELFRSIPRIGMLNPRESPNPLTLLVLSLALLNLLCKAVENPEDASIGGI